MLLKTVAFLVCFALMFQSGSCVKCYMCTSRLNSGCAELDSVHLEPKECSSIFGFPQAEDVPVYQDFKNIRSQVTDELNKHLQCIKTVRTENGNKIVERGCDVVGRCELTGGFLEHCSICSTDGCNGSHAITASLAVLVLSTVVAVFKHIC